METLFFISLSSCSEKCVLDQNLPFILLGVDKFYTILYTYTTCSHMRLLWTHFLNLIRTGVRFNALSLSYGLSSAFVSYSSIISIVFCALYFKTTLSLAETSLFPKFWISPCWLNLKCMNDELEFSSFEHRYVLPTMLLLGWFVVVLNFLVIFIFFSYPRNVEILSKLWPAVLDDFPHIRPHN